MVALKGCPRCRGDVFLEHDIYGWYRSCLQCGYTVDADREIEAPADSAASPLSREKEAVATTVGRR